MKPGEVIKEKDIYKVASMTSPDVIYEVKKSPQGRVFCNCPASVFGNKTDCKHLKAVLQFVKKGGV